MRSLTSEMFSRRIVPSPAIRGSVWPAFLMLAAFAAFSPHPRFASAGGIAPEEMLRIADGVRHPIDEGVIRIRAAVVNPGETDVVSLLDVLVQGRDRVLYLFRSGPLAGRRVLMVEEKTWLLIPDVARPIPISANQRLLGGISIGEVARLSFASEYSAAMRDEEETVGDELCRVIDLRARNRKASYPVGTLWIGREDGLPKKAELALASGKPSKLLFFESYEQGEEGGARLERMRIVHLLPGERDMETVLEFTGYERRNLDPGIFDPAEARDVP